MEVEQLYDMNTLENRKEIVEPEPIFKDSFNCMMGEDKCPIKKQNALLTNQVDRQKSGIYEKQREIERLQKIFDDKLLESKGEEELKSVVKEVQQSIIVRERDKIIESKDQEIEKLRQNIAKGQDMIATLEKEREEYMTTGYEADIKFKERFKQYQDLIKKHDHLLAKATDLEAKATKLGLVIHENTAYQHELSAEINRMVVIAREREKHIAKLKIEKGKLEKVKPVKYDSRNPLSRITGLFRKKNASQAGK